MCRRRRRRRKNGRRAWNKNQLALFSVLSNTIFSFSFIRDFVQKTFSASIFRTFNRSLAYEIKFSNFFFGVCDDIFILMLYSLWLINKFLNRSNSEIPLIWSKLWELCENCFRRQWHVWFYWLSFEAPTPYLRVLVIREKGKF